MEKWTFTLTFKSSVSIFTGLAAAGLVDRMVIRNHDDIPLIPGSSIKGRWRFFAERLLNSGVAIPGLFKHPEGPICKDANNACTICRLFGNSAMPSLLWVDQAGLREPFRTLFYDFSNLNNNTVIHQDVELRPGVALSRTFRTPLKDHLFFDEAVPPVSFSGEIIFNGMINPEEKKFLVASARLVDRIGARKSVGRGILENGINILVDGIDILVGGTK